MQLIDLDDLKYRCEHPDYTLYNGDMLAEWVKHCIVTAPTIEAEPVIHAHWIPQYVSTRGNTDKFECSNCNTLSHTAYMMKMCPDNYCKNCGAKMDGKESEDGKVD